MTNRLNFLAIYEAKNIFKFQPLSYEDLLVSSFYIIVNIIFVDTDLFLDYCLDKKRHTEDV